jgi:uncharacterized protein (TIGR03435 family)
LYSAASGLADFLQKKTNITVIDQTGLKGIYAWSWNYYFAGGMDPDHHFQIPTPSTDLPLNMGVWHDEGLQKDGLRLIPTTVPLENIVIDRLERIPT